MRYREPSPGIEIQEVWKMATDGSPQIKTTIGHSSSSQLVVSLPVWFIMETNWKSFNELQPRMLQLKLR